jgi:hypothetical protein
MDDRSEPADGLSLDAWLALLQEVPGLAAVEVSRDEQRALLDLTRVAAHRSVRAAAPITAFLVGLALASSEPAQRAARIRHFTALLEPSVGDGPAAPLETGTG